MERRGKKCHGVGVGKGGKLFALPFSGGHSCKVIHICKECKLRPVCNKQHRRDVNSELFLSLAEEGGIK